VKSVAEHSDKVGPTSARAINGGSAGLAPKSYGISFADDRSSAAIGGSGDAEDAGTGVFADQSTPILPLLRPGRAPPAIRRMCAACEGEEEGMQVQRKANGSIGESCSLTAPPAVSAALAQPRQSLDSAARNYLENRSGNGLMPAAAPLAIQRKCASCLDEPRILPQLEVGRADDPLEIEADEMADHVVRRMSVNVDGNAVAQPVQAKSRGAGTATSGSGLDAGIASASGSGAPLANQTRNRMEEAFDADFSSVRVHTSSASAEMCDEIGARAFTYGTDIHFNAGEYAPSTEHGTRLLAHELTHVVQQNDSVRLAPKRIQAKPAQLGPRVFGPKSGMPGGNIIHNKGLLPTFSGPGLNPGLWVEPSVPGANRGVVGRGLSGKPDFYRDNAFDGQPIGINEGKITGFVNLKNPGLPAPLAPATPGGPVLDLKRAPRDIELGDVKPGLSGEEDKGHDQLEAYSKGVRNTAKAVDDYQTAKGHDATHGLWNLGPGQPTPMKRLDVPDKLAKSNKAGVGFGPLSVYEWIGRWIFRSETAMEGSCVVYKSRIKGIWAYEWMPVSVPENLGDAPIQKDLLKRLEKDVKPRLHSSKKPATKLKQRQVVAPRQSPSKTPRPVLQRKPKPHDKFDEQGWLKTYNPWRADAEKGLSDPKTAKSEVVLDALAEGKKRTKTDPGTPQAVVERTEGFSAIRHWVRYGKLYAWFRKTFDRVYVKLAGFAQKVKEKVKKLSRSASSSGFGNWVKAAALALFKVAKKLGAWAISMIVDKLQDSLQEGVSNIIKQLAEAVTPEGVKSKIEEIEELKAKYEQMLSETQESLEKRLFGDKLEMFSKLDEYMKIASTVSTIVSVVRWGIRIVACASPPLVGCLWNLAMAALEFAFAKIMETCWFSAKVLGWIRDSGIQAILDFPTKAAQTIANLGNDVLKLPDGIGPLFGEIKINHREFDIDCKAGGDENGGGPEPTEEQKALMELAKEVGDEKFEAALEMLAKRAADHNVALDAERIKKLGPLIKALSVAQMKALAANQPTEGVPVSVEEFLKSIATLTEKEIARKEERKIDYDKAQRSNPKFEQSQIKWKPELFVKPGIASDSKEFADAIYDIQKMLGIKADGMAGPNTTKLYYERNSQPKDEAYDNAAKLVEAEKQARAEKRRVEKRRKELRALLNEPDIKAALEAPFPSDEQLKKDLTPLHWENVDNDSMQFIQHKGLAIVGIKTEKGHSLGAYFHFVEREFPGTKTKMKMIVNTSKFYTLDGIPEMDGIGNLITLEDGTTGIELIALKERPKDSFFAMEPIFFGRFFEF